MNEWRMNTVDWAIRAINCPMHANLHDRFVYTDMGIVNGVPTAGRWPACAWEEKAAPVSSTHLQSNCSWNLSMVKAYMQPMWRQQAVLPAAAVDRMTGRTAAVDPAITVSECGLFIWPWSILHLAWSLYSRARVVYRCHTGRVAYAREFGLGTPFHKGNGSMLNLSARGHYADPDPWIHIWPWSPKRRYHKRSHAVIGSEYYHRLFTTGCAVIARTTRIGGLMRALNIEFKITVWL